jgi:hypothetical protein
LERRREATPVESAACKHTDNAEHWQCFWHATAAVLQEINRHLKQRTATDSYTSSKTLKQ